MVRLPAGGPRWQFVEKTDLFGRFSWALGIDGIAMLLIVLTVFLVPLCILASWKAIAKRVPEYMAVFLLTELLMLGVFMAQDLFLFYIMFEGGLIPMYMIIGIWGGARRIYASYKFFLYTLLGSVLMLIAMLMMAHTAGTTEHPDADGVQLPAGGAGLAVPRLLRLLRGEDADVARPHLASRRARRGADRGLGDPGGRDAQARGLRLPALLAADVPAGSAHYMWLIFALSMIATVYTSLVALVQKDMKKLIAYSSVAHMALVTFGLFAFNEQGIEGAMMVMLGHGLVSSALFLCVGVVYDRLHTREIDRYGGIANNMPYYAVFFLFFTMASVGLPGSQQLPRRVPVDDGHVRESSWAAFIAVTGIITGAAYMLYLYRRIAFGPQKNADAAAMADLEPREWLILAPLAAATLWMGVYPESFIAPMRADVAAILQRVEPTAPASDAAVTAPHAAKPAVAAAGER